MNKVLLVARLTSDPKVTKKDDLTIARFNVAVDRKGKDKGADFPSIVSFGKTAEFIEKYFSKGMRIGIVGHIQTGKYEKDGHTVYTTDVCAEEVEFVESKKDGEKKESLPDGFETSIPEGEDMELPFS